MSDDTPSSDRPGDHRPGEPGRSGPGPRHVVRPPGVLGPEDCSSGPLAADRLTVVAHELRNMLDGSMRWLGVVAATLPESEVAAESEKLSAAREQILTVQHTLERMSSMVNAALRSKAVPIGSPLLGVSSVVSLAMAIDHAMDVVRPLAGERGVQLRLTIEPAAGCVPAGPMYTVILNGLINAVEAIGRAAERDTLNPGGTIEITARCERGGEEVILDIADDGAGLDSAVRGEKAFRHGVTTRPDGYGIGLAISRQIVESMEGVISLAEREDRVGSNRPGAVLRVRIPTNNERFNPDRKVG